MHSKGMYLGLQGTRILVGFLRVSAVVRQKACMHAIGANDIMAGEGLTWRRRSNALCLFVTGRLNTFETACTYSQKIDLMIQKVRSSAFVYRRRVAHSKAMHQRLCIESHAYAPLLWQEKGIEKSQPAAACAYTVANWACLAENTWWYTTLKYPTSSMVQGRTLSRTRSNTLVVCGPGDGEGSQAGI